MKRARQLTLFLFLVAGIPHSPALLQSPSRPDREHVILLHGLGRSPRSMAKLAGRLRGRGYAVLNLAYPSRDHSIEYLAEEILHPRVERLLNSRPARIDFITHSMGGIVVRYYLKHHRLEKLGRVVMLAPPNQGSELVDRMKTIPFLEKSLGPAGRELGKDRDSLPLKLGRARFALGVIAGNRSGNLLNSIIIDGPDDGSVSVRSTRLPGMDDFIVLPCSHRSLLKSDEAIEQALHFLEYGSFKRKAGS
jgi:pimeloyl-ACP methyl ester carboxylesterase